MPLSAREASILLDSFERILYERMFSTEDDYIRNKILESVSPVIRIVYHNGIQVSINRNDYGLDYIVACTHDYHNNASVFIDGQDIFEYD